MYVCVCVQMGERFDPSKHEALFEVEDATKARSNPSPPLIRHPSIHLSLSLCVCVCICFVKQHKGTVVHVLKSGYRIKERVLRPAKVGTSKGGPPPPKQEEAKQ